MIYKKKLDKKLDKRSDKRPNKKSNKIKKKLVIYYWCAENATSTINTNYKSNEICEIFEIFKILNVLMNFLTHFSNL